MGAKYHKRSVPWPIRLKDPGPRAPSAASPPQKPKKAPPAPRRRPAPPKPPPPKKGPEKEPRILGATVTARFFGDCFMIGTEPVIANLPKKLHRISVDNYQVLKLDRKVLDMKPDDVYRIKARLYESQQEKLDAERKRLKESGGKGRRPYLG